MTTEADRNDMQRLIEANDTMLAQRDEQIRGLEARLTTALGLLRGTEQACERLKATNAELQAECDQWQKKLTEDAWPEIERLRAALRERVSEGHWFACKISVGRCNCSYEDAEAALAGSKRA